MSRRRQRRATATLEAPELVGPSAMPGLAYRPQQGLTGVAGGWNDWLPTAARVALALVFLWFGLHELLQPHLWTGYVPVLSPTSSLATIAVLGHGWLLTMLGVALLAGISSRAAALIGAVLMAEILIALGAHGVTDIVIRDLGVFGLALGVAAQPQHRLVVTR